MAMPRTGHALLVGAAAAAASTGCHENPALPEASLLAEDTYIGDVATDGEWVYWLASPGRLMRVPLSGGAAALVVDDGDYVDYLVLGAQTIYWGDLGTEPGFFCGRLLAVDKAGGPVRIITDRSGGGWCWATPLVEEEDRLMVFGWGDGLALGNLDPVSGEPTQVIELTSVPRAFEVRASGYYILLGEGRIVHMTRDGAYGTVIDDIRSPEGMAIGTDYITWADGNYVGRPDEVYRAPRYGGLYILLHTETARLVGAPVQVQDDVWFPLSPATEDADDGGLLRIRLDGTVDVYDVDYVPQLLRAADDQLIVLTASPPDTFEGTILIQPLP
jgi:hypothetical protein